MNPSNYSSISFPFLGIEINPPRMFSVGPFTAHYYGLIIAVGLILAVLYAMRRSKEFGLKEDDILDGVIWVTPFAIACARAYYVAFTWESYRDDPISVLYIWEGGIAIYGGVIGAIIGMVVMSRIKKVKFTTVLDLILMVFLLGQAIGRWGNFMNREAFGAATDSFFRMGLYNEKLQQWEYYHPTFLYESVWNLAGFVLLACLAKKRRYDGQLALGYAAWYGLGRSIIEGLRVDSLWWGPFRVSQLLAAVTCVVAVVILLLMNLRKHDRSKLYVNYVNKMDAVEAAVEEIFQKTEEE